MIRYAAGERIRPSLPRFAAHTDKIPGKPANGRLCVVLRPQGPEYCASAVMIESTEPPGR